MSLRRDEVAVFLAQIPDLERFDEAQLSVVELRGTTNRNFRIATPTGRFALRLPAEDRAGFVDRGWEVRSAQLAANAGIGAPLIYADTATGVMLTRWIEGVPLTAAAVRNDPAIPGRVAALLKTLHRSNIQLPRLFDAFTIMQTYRHALAERGSFQVRWSERLSAALGRARHQIRLSPNPVVPCHCDPVPHNFLDAGEQLVLVDWEYAGMNDPAWDLAYFALEAEMAPDAIEALVAAYGDVAIPLERLRSYQLVAAALGVLWSDLRDPVGEDSVLAEWALARLHFAESLAAQA